MANVLEALRKTSKGKLKYDSNWKGTHNELDVCSKSPTISSIDVLEGLKSLSIKDTKPGKHSLTKEESLSRKKDDSFNFGPENFDSTHVSLYQYELQMKQEAKERMHRRKMLFENHSNQLQEQKRQALQQQLEERRNEFLELVQVLKQDLKKYEHQTAQNQKALMLQHKKTAARVSEKVEMIEYRKQQAEEEKKNQQDLLQLRNYQNDIKEAFEQLDSSVKNCNVKDSLDPKAVSTIIDEAKKVFDLSTNTLKDCTSAGKALNGSLQQVPQYLTMMKSLLDNALQAISIAEQKKKKELAEKEAKQKEDEKKRKEEEEKKKKEATAKKVDTLSSNISSTVVTEYARLEKILEGVTKSIEPFISSKEKSIKKLRMALQRAVTTPINTISDQSPSLLLEKITNLAKLLSGQQIESFGNALSTSMHPNAPIYCKNLLALKVVEQGSRQVSSNHNAAFPLASLVIGIWSTFPDVGDLVLAHFYQQCPFLVPMYIPQTQGMTDEEYFKKLGYLCENGNIEPRDKYLKRISGTIRLYGAIVSSLPPMGSTPNHPHGISSAWMWLARILNLPPKADYTATALFEFLDVAGHALQSQYGRQFWKLVFVIVREFIPRIRQITGPSQSAPVVRLEIFLEKAFQARRMEKPEGYLDARWWNSTGFSGISGS